MDDRQESRDRPNADVKTHRCYRYLVLTKLTLSNDKIVGMANLVYAASPTAAATILGDIYMGGRRRHRSFKWVPGNVVDAQPLVVLDA
jgi:hypothetical protein